MSGDYAVGRDLDIIHAKEGAAMFNKKVNLLKRSGVKEKIEPFTGSEFPRIVLSFDCLFSTHALQCGYALLKIFHKT